VNSPQQVAAAARNASKIFGSGPEAVRATKRLILERPSPDELARLISEVRASAEGQAGLRALLTEEDPPWRSAPS
jgi:methylglutaconyl-CoA hydratase